MRIILILLLSLCIILPAFSMEICGGLTETGKNNEEYLRNRWEELLGFDLFFGYFWIKETRNTMARETIKYIGINKFEWDVSLKIKTDEFYFQLNKKY